MIEPSTEVYGHKLGCFAERSFNSTLRILKGIKDSATPHQLDDNHEKSKPEMGVSEAAMEAELEDRENSGMVTRIKSWLFLSVFNILAYVFFSQTSIMEGSICENIDAKTYYYQGVSEQVLTYLAAFDMLFCQHEFWVQISMAVLMMCVVMYLTICRFPGIWNEIQLVTFDVICLGIGSGLPGKVFVDAMGGNGKLWLFVWATFCVFQFLVDVTLALCGLIRSCKCARPIGHGLVSSLE